MSKGLSRILSSSLLVLAGLALLAFHHWGYVGHYGFDDLEYAELAFRTLKGTVDFTNHFSYRTAIIWPTALSYWLFGVSDFSSALPPLLATFSILILIFLVCRKAGPVSVAIAFAFALGTEWFLFYSDKLMPDMYVALSVMLAACVLYRWRATPWGGLALALALFIGFSAKATIILIIPWLAFLVAGDLLRRDHLKFWGAAFITTLVLGGFYAIWSYYVSGEFTGRLTAIATNGYLNACSYDQQPLSAVIARVGWEFWDMGFRQGLFICLPVILAGLFRRERGKRQKDQSFFLYGAVILLFSANFMSISPSAYVPMCLDIRHYLYLTPIMAVAAARLLPSQLENKKTLTLLMAFFMAFAVVAHYSEKVLLSKVYLALVLLTAIYFIIKKYDQKKIAFTFGTILIISFLPYQIVPYAKNVNYRGQRDFITKELNELPVGSLLLADPVQARLATYWLEFDTSRVRAIRSATANWWETPSPSVYFLRNRHTGNLSGATPGVEPWYLKLLQSDALMAQHKDLGITLYDASPLQKILSKRVELKQTLLTFSEADEAWRLGSDIRKEQADGSENRFEHVGEFSSTFEYPVDSLHIDEQMLILETQCRARSSSPGTVLLVLSIEEGERVLFRSESRIDNELLAPGIWWPVKWTESVAGEVLAAGAKIKVYFYNPTKGDLELDDFQVRLLAYPQMEK